jgi:O-antigen/teichoic acid export membrane protein
MLSRISKMQQKSFILGSIITIVFNGFSILISGITSIFVAHALGPQELGYLMLFMTGTTIIAMFADLMGIYYSNAYLIASNNHKFELSTIRGTVLVYGIIVGFITGSIFGFFPPVRLLIFRGFHEPIWGILIGLSVLGIVLLNQIRGLFLGHRNFLMLGILGLTQVALYSFLALSTTYILFRRTGAEVATMYLVATWVCVAGALVLLSRQGIARPSFRHIKACAQVGWRAAITNWLSFLQLRVDQYLVNWLLGPAALGLYGVAVSCGELLTRVPGMIGSVIFPLVAAEKNKTLMARITLRRSGLVMAFVGLLSVPIGVFAEDLIGFLYGGAFTPSARALQFLLPAVIFMSGLLIIDNHLAGLGYPMMKIIALLISLLANILGNLVLLPRLGIIGASMTSSFSYLIWLLLVMGYLRWIAHKTCLWGAKR